MARIVYRPHERVYVTKELNGRRGFLYRTKVDKVEVSQTTHKGAAFEDARIRTQDLGRE